jgi:hypothetical protein
MFIMNCNLLIAFVEVVVLITRGKACQHATSSTTNHTWNGLLSNLGLRGVRPVSNLRKKLSFLLDFTAQGLMLASNATPQLCTTYWQLNFSFFSFTVRVCEFLLCCQSSDVVTVTSEEILPALLCLKCDDTTGT